MKISRIFSDDRGESHFEDLEVRLAETPFIEGAQPFDLSAPWPAERVSVAQLPPRWSDSRHRTPVRQLVVFLAGAAEMRASDGEVRMFESGDLVLLEDVSGEGHGTRIVGDDGAQVLLIRLS